MSEPSTLNPPRLVLLSRYYDDILSYKKRICFIPTSIWSFITNIHILFYCIDSNRILNSCFRQIPFPFRLRTSKRPYSSTNSDAGSYFCQLANLPILLLAVLLGLFLFLSLFGSLPMSSGR